jgi:aldose 1-epimerase
VRIAFVLLTLQTMTLFAQYTVSDAADAGVPVIVLRDAAADTEVRIVPSIGNIAYSMKVRGTEVFWKPPASLAELKAKPAQMGNPLLAPWANRIEGMSYWINGKQHQFEKGGDLRPDANGNPIHGLVIYADRWQVTGRGNDNGAWVRSRLDFSKHADWMRQFPFAHTIEMTYRLQNGELEVDTSVSNQAAEPLPIAIGYHPWFQIPGGRDRWTLRIAARERVELSPTLIPTGKRTPVTATDLALKGAKQDDVYTSLLRDAQGRAEFWVTNGKQKLSVIYGPKYSVAVVYAPPARDVVCFEPMAAITDAFNQHHAGRYPELQSIDPGATWRESFWIRPAGF